MKITNKRSRGIEYGELNIGSCFELNGKFYIKTDIIEDFVLSDKWAVNLETGEKCGIGSAVKVNLIQTELLIN